ncbi:MAG: response regulator [Candidatus Angelobacter sp.]
MKTLKILIAEDDPLTQSLLQKLLTGWGYAVVAVHDGKSACQVLERGGIHVCLLDWEMPELSGRDLCEWIHTAYLRPSPYVILLTAKGAPQQILDGFAAGADDYITKPFERDDLRFRVAELALRVLKADAIGEEVRRTDPIDIYRLDLRRYRKELSHNS